jgi:hypothetical protein
MCGAGVTAQSRLRSACSASENDPAQLPTHERTFAADRPHFDLFEPTSRHHCARPGRVGTQLSSLLSRLAAFSVVSSRHARIIDLPERFRSALGLHGIYLG